MDFSSEMNLVMVVMVMTVWSLYNVIMEDSRRAKQALHRVPDEKKKPTSTTHYLERHSVERHRTDGHGMGRRVYPDT